MQCLYLFVINVFCFGYSLGGASEGKSPVTLEQLSSIVKKTDEEREDGESGGVMRPTAFKYRKPFSVML